MSTGDRSSKDPQPFVSPAKYVAVRTAVSVPVSTH
jgi:hypothetical protein